MVWMECKDYRSSRKRIIERNICDYSKEKLKTI